jgi:hypothetical protein
VPTAKTFSGSSTTCTKKGLVAFEANPHHRRAELVVLSDKTFDAAMRLQGPWVNSHRRASAPTIDLVIGYNKTTSPFLELFLSRRPAEEEGSADALIVGAELRVFSAIEAKGGQPREIPGCG